jgi:hypothetical protein
VIHGRSYGHTPLAVSHAGDAERFAPVIGSRAHWVYPVSIPSRLPTKVLTSVTTLTWAEKSRWKSSLRNLSDGAAGAEMTGIDAHSSPSRRHYDLFARVYDGVADHFYGHARRAAIEHLQLKPGSLVLDVACGTGLNLPHIVARLSHAGVLVGVDGSSGIIEKARERARRNRWDSLVRLIEYDARALSRELPSHLIPDGNEVDRVLFTLALSVAPSRRRRYVAPRTEILTNHRTGFRATQQAAKRSCHRTHPVAPPGEAQLQSRDPS